LERGEGVAGNTMGVLWFVGGGSGRICLKIISQKLKYNSYT